MSFEIVFHDGPLPPLRDAPLTEREIAFRDMLRKPALYARWAEQTRINWTANRGRDNTVTGAASDRSAPRGRGAASPKETKR